MTSAPPRVDAEVLAAHLLIQRALELAGKRLLTRERRGSYSGDVRQLYRVVTVAPAQLERLLAGAFDWCDELGGLIALDPARLRHELTDYVGGLLTTGTQHEVRYLTAVLSKARTSGTGIR